MCEDAILNLFPDFENKKSFCDAKPDVSAALYPGIASTRQTSAEAIKDSASPALVKQRAINACVARGTPEHRTLKLSDSKAYQDKLNLKCN
jgi:hypothetical protein